MKKLMRSYLFQLVLVIATAMTMHSCSCKGETSIEGKLDKVSDKAQVVAVLNLEQIMAQTEITTNDKGEIELPSYMTKLMSAFMSSRDLRDFNKITEFRGIDYTQVVFAGYDLDDTGKYDFEEDEYVDGSAFFMAIFNVKDEDDFIKSVKEIDESARSSERDGYTVLSTLDDNGPKFLIKGSLAYLVKDDVTPSELEKKLEKAKETPLSEGKKEYLNREGTVGAFIVGGNLLDEMPREFRTGLAMGADIDLSTAMFGGSLKLNGPTVSANFALLDKDGKAVQLKIGRQINSDILSFVNENDLMVGAVGINSLNYIDKLPTLGYSKRKSEELKEVLKPFADFKDLTVMFACGMLTDKPFSDGFNPQKDIRYTFAINGQGGDMENLFGYICDWLSAMELAEEGYEYNVPVMGRPSRNYGTDYTASMKIYVGYDYYTDTYKYDTMKLYAKKSGNTVIVSNAPITKKGSKNFTAEDVNGKTAYMKVVMPKDLPNLKGLKIPTGAIFMATTGETSEVDMNLSLTGTDKKFIPAIAEMILNAGN